MMEIKEEQSHGSRHEHSAVSFNSSKFLKVTYSFSSIASLR